LRRRSVPGGRGAHGLSSFMTGLELRDSAREKIMWKNAAELFRIAVPERSGS